MKNPIVGRICIPRLFAACKEYGLPKPELIDFDGDFRVNMYRKRDTNTETNTKTNTETNTNMEANTETVGKIIRLMPYPYVPKLLPISAFIVAVIAYVIWTIGLKRYNSTGGIIYFNCCF